MNLPSGPKVHAIMDVVGIGIGDSPDDLKISSGYDDRVEVEENGRHRDLTRDEQIELADLMIARWQTYKEKVRSSIIPQRTDQPSP